MLTGTGKLRALAFAALIAGAAAPLSAAFSISASVDKTVVAINDSLQLEITIKSDSRSIPDPDIPEIKGFEIYSSGKSSNISFINGKFSSSVVFSYTLVPRFIGKFKIPPVIVYSGGKRHMTEEIEIEVVKSFAQTPRTRKTQTARPSVASPGSGAGKALFMTAETDKKTAFKGEQVTLTVRFFTAVPLVSNPEYNAPELTGFISEDLPPVRNGETVIDGRPYYYNEIKTALFPLEQGTATIGKASVKAMVQTGLDFIDPFSSKFFQRFFSGAGFGGGKLKVLETNPIKIKVLDLPGEPPPSFSGAVGEYEVRVKLDKNRVKRGDTLNFSVIVEGKGNLDSISRPEFPELPDFKIYDITTSASLNKKNDAVGGKKIFNAIMMPRKPGDYVFPPVTFSFFNPSTGKYREIRTGNLRLKVLENKERAESGVYFPGKNIAVNPGGGDIQYIFEKTETPPHFKISRKIVSLGELNLFFLLLAVLGAAFSWARELHLRNPAKIRKNLAHRKASETLKRARKKAGENQCAEASGLMYSALNNYLADKLGMSPNAVNLKKCAQTIKERHRGVSDIRLSELKNLWHKVETLRFSGGAAEAKRVEETLKECETTLENLEKEFKK